METRLAWLQVAGEDLTPYRQASKLIWNLLQQYGPVQRGGLDEAFVDATAEVRCLWEACRHALRTRRCARAAMRCARRDKSRP